MGKYNGKYHVGERVWCSGNDYNLHFDPPAEAVVLVEIGTLYCVKVLDTGRVLDATICYLAPMSGPPETALYSEAFTPEMIDWHKTFNANSFYKAIDR